MTYKILANRSAASLEKEVNECIKNGFIPLGGISIDGKGFYCQAVIKKEPSKQARIEGLITRRDAVNAGIRRVDASPEPYDEINYANAEKDLLDIAKEFMKL